MRVFPRAGRWSTVAMVFGLLPPAGLAQTAPRTAWGDPDLQGIWNHGTATLLEAARWEEQQVEADRR